MRVLTSNIQSFPASAPDAKPGPARTADMKAIRAMDPDVVLWQEIVTPQAFNDIIAAFGNTEYGTAAHQSECVVTWHNALLGLTVHTHTTRVAPAAPGPFSPARDICYADFAVAGLPDVRLIDVHFTNDVYTGERRADRKPMWQDCWNGTNTAVWEALDKGQIVIVGGDWNRAKNEIPAFGPSQVWVVGGGNSIDAVAVVLPAGWGVTVTKTINQNINSDHNVQGADLAFERTFSKAEHAAIDALAAARTALAPLTTPQAAKAAASVQTAINDLYGV